MHIEKIQPLASVVTDELEQAIALRINTKTKPLGSLGLLEDIAKQIAKIQLHQKNDASLPLAINLPTCLVFAADHGISEEGVSIANSEVTSLMVENFAHGGAAINCFCRSNNIRLEIIDAGIKQSLSEAYTNLTEQRVGDGTANFVKKPAMSAQQCEQALLWGAMAANRHIIAGCNLLILGEMGIGNTSSASAILAAITGESVKVCVGTGTGIDKKQLIKKTQLIEKALSRFKSRDVKNILKQVGGFEIVQMVGAIVAACEAGITVLVDGFIVSVAALAACKIAPACRDYLVFSHASAEKPHQLVLDTLDAKPILNLGLCLGEGTGAALALPIVKSACAFYNEMASLESVGITV
ncbi:nicotinate-nucleotide--dimethylbenzimidazole phosphoribosyltransferase [Catenovulum sp. SM1970]|uniref:nicotinate-nucleotide--dimethylbenzimidazole phosphoribosyltransferase n=1 Tax=Marinifaba aquimaris TaxID=2741323 RepID=UPI001574E27E|nr:nicotinate-nucleotide--dimethylbenzimidazole phosphoribosyltransferase [Marinifaba aquimaris]NTS77772.1 nicotinate-nucleotide--dimethylbenzimidazole phosphoribosyltransferase [Marinifaba aquimaris]